MPPATILHTIETGGPGGAETVLLRLASHSKWGPYRSIALVPSDDWLERELAANHVRTITFTPGSRPLESLWRTIVRYNVSIVHSHLPDQNFLAAVAGLVSRRPVVVTVHGMLDLARASQFWPGLKQRFVNRQAERIVGVSDHVLDGLRDLGADEAKLVRIHNGVAMPSATTGSGVLRAELSIPKSHSIVGTVANIRRPKGYAYLMRAAAEVVKWRSTVHFVAAGDLDSPEIHELLELRSSLDLDDHFHFLGFRSDIAAILYDLDVFVLASTSEGFSLATIEAMAAGRPVVVTASGGPEEIVTHESDGWIVPPRDVVALSQAIITLLRNRRMAERIGMEARRTAEDRFSLGAMVGQYHWLYGQVLGLDIDVRSERKEEVR